MRLKNILIVVKDIEASKKYYHDLLGLNTILDNDGNMILTKMIGILSFGKMYIQIFKLICISSQIFFSVS